MVAQKLFASGTVLSSCKSCNNSCIAKVKKPRITSLLAIRKHQIVVPAMKSDSPEKIACREWYYTSV